MTITFGPTTNLAVLDTTQLGDQAATSLTTTSTSSLSLVPSVGSTVASVVVGPYPYATSVVATASGQWNFTVGGSADAISVFEIVSDIPPGTSQPYKTLAAGNTSLPASTQQGGSFADEATFSLAPGATLTAYVNAYFTRSTSGSTATLSDVTLKLETIKK